MIHVLQPGIACPLRFLEHVIHQTGRKHSRNHMNTCMNITGLYLPVSKQNQTICMTKMPLLYNIMASSNYKKVGYIAHELTKFVHPLLSDLSLEVSVNKIRFFTRRYKFVTLII